MSKDKSKNQIEQTLERLNPDEKAIIPHLKKECKLKEILEEIDMEEVKVSRALQYLSNKGVLALTEKKEKIVDLDKNGVVYLKNNLPERRLLNFISKKKTIRIKEAKENSDLSGDEFRAALGALKDKAMVSISKGILKLEGGEISKKTLEEKFLENLPIKLEELKPEQKLAYKNLKKRKDIIKLEEKKEVNIELTKKGEKLRDKDLSKYEDMIEELTPKIIKNEDWRGKKFRKYDLKSDVPKISGGKRHFVNQAKDYARKVWTEMGFEEMTGKLTQIGFWNFDALFQPQDHPAREMHDTFYLDLEGSLPDKNTVDMVKKAHEEGTSGSKGWQYDWEEDEAKRVLLRTHTTCLSAQTLVKMRETDQKRGKFFSVGKNFRNETIDWSHGFELNQTEGIVVDPNVNFRHLLGYLKQFAKKMGFDEVKFHPAYFPYTEPSVEGEVWNEDKEEWVEVFAAGIFRPEVTKPLLGEPVPVLAWGPGFDRMLMKLFDIKDLRDLYKNDLNQLREIKYLPR